MTGTVQAKLKAVSTAVPPYRLTQKDARDGARRVFAHRIRDFDRFAGVFDHAGIEARYSCVPLDWYMEPRGWPEKNDLYLHNAIEVLERASTDCLAQTGIEPTDVDAVVCVSSTGIATPSLDALLMQRMGFRPDTLRLPVFGLGCVGGVIGLARAAMIAQAMPGATVLFLVVELCALSFRHGDPTKSNIVATALFGDGAAAAVIRADDEPGTSLRAWGEHTWPDTLDVMGWRVESDGLGVLFSPRIPALVEAGLGTAADNFLQARDMTVGNLNGVVCHPGGAKVLEALSRVFAAAPAGLDDARGVLRDYGNMSAVTVLFVLARRLKAGGQGPHLMTALGPGFTAGFLLLDLQPSSP